MSVAARESAVALVWRSAQAHNRREVLWLRRGAQLTFGAGFYAFPGGKTDPEDARVPVVGAAGNGARLRACAVRECFEETGLLLARGVEKLHPRERQELRAALASGVPFPDLLARAGLTLQADDLIEAGRWITPEFYPRRFDAWMFLAQAPPDAEGPQAVALAADEAADGGFTSPAEALRRWKDGSALLHPPNWNALEAFSEADGQPDLAPAIRRLQRPPLADRLPAAGADPQPSITHRIEFQQGIVLIPQRTPTLPPATHTSAYLLGTGQAVLVDPGTDEPHELAALYAVVDQLRSEGRTPVAVALTHHHFDHLGGARAVQQRYDLPLWAHALTADGLAGRGLGIDRMLEDGEALGLSGMDFEALHTPGHTRGHLSFWHRPSGAAVVGDLVSGLSTVVIAPPEGDMTDYLASLNRLLSLKIATLYPAHGPPMTDGPTKLGELIAHRAAREGMIVAALGEGLATPADIVPRVYPDLSGELVRLAQLTVQAHLDKLVNERRAEVTGTRYTLPPVGAPSAH